MMRRYRKSYHSSKKASLEISIQAIVIVVLAMTLLGLGLTFVKKMFGNIDVVSSGTFDKIQEQLQRDLTNSNEKLVFSQSKITLERGSQKLLGWGIKNIGSQRLNYYVQFTTIKCPQDTCPNQDTLNRVWLDYKYNPSRNPSILYQVDAASSQFERVNFNIPRNALPGLYLIDMSVYDDTSITTKYSSTDIFLTVG